MKLPVQAQPVLRNTSDVVRNDGSVAPSVLCDLACNFLPEPAKSICKAAC